MVNNLSKEKIMTVQSFSNVESLDIESSVKVTVTKSSKFQVKVIGEEPNKVQISQSGTNINIKYVEEYQNNISISGNNIFIGNVVSSNFSIGDLYINGKRVNTTDLVEDTKPKPVSEIEIYCPDNLQLICNLVGNANLTATTEFKSVNVNISGACTAKLSAHQARFKISGSGKVSYKSLGGNLRVTISGSGEINAEGTFKDIDATISGSAELNAQGNVEGDYDVTVSGSGRVYHSGKILGQKSKSVSGCGSVSW